MVKKVLFIAIAMIALAPLLLIANESDSILPNLIGIGYLVIWAAVLKSPLGEALFNIYKNLFENGRND